MSSAGSYEILSGMPLDEYMQREVFGPARDEG